MVVIGTILTTELLALKKTETYILKNINFLMLTDFLSLMHSVN